MEIFPSTASLKIWLAAWKCQVMLIIIGTPFINFVEALASFHCTQIIKKRQIVKKHVTNELYHII